MAGKRKDLKQRNLPDGVSQKKDGAYKGRYCYTYSDLDGMRHCVYSYRLFETDPIPNDKNLDSCVPLMTTIAQIQRDLEDGIRSFDGRNITLNDVFEQYMELRPGIKESTRNANYSKWRLYLQDGLGKKKVVKITYSDVKKLCLQLLWDWPNRQTGEKGLNIGTVEDIHVLIYSVFKLAKKNKIIRDNPADGIMAEIKAENKCKVNQSSGQAMKSLTVVQQKNFLSYVREHYYYKWYNLFIVLFGTGMRAGELCALRRDDLDFENDVIYINHTLEYFKGVNESHHTFHMTSPKTAAGKRTIPMFPEVKAALLRELENQLKTGHNKATADGYTGFVFQTSMDNPIQYNGVDSAIRRIVRRYNKEEETKAREEKRKPELLPYFSAHDIRHTFATRMAENRANQLVMKKVMGHESVETTLDVYAEVTESEKRECFDELDGCMGLA